MAVKITHAAKRDMHIHGLPYQFTDIVDPRFDDVSPTVGRKYFQNILMSAPILTLIPGEPSYLPGVDDKVSTSKYLIKSASSDFSLVRAKFSDIANKKDGSEIRYYDFMPAYTTYMSYVNILCRAMATFLEIEEKDADTGDAFTQYDWQDWTNSGSLKNTTVNLIKTLGKNVYTWSEAVVEKVKSTTSGGKTSSGKTTSKTKNGETSGSTNRKTTTGNSKAKTGTTGSTNSSGKKTADKKSTKEKVTYVEKSVTIGERDMLYQTTNPVTTSYDKKGKMTVSEEEGITETLDMILTNKNYVQFYVDMETTGYSESFGNETSTSQLKGMFDNGQAIFKELAFVMNSGGSAELVEGLGEFADSAADSISKNLLSGNNLTSTMGRLLGLTGNVIKGENVIMPDIYQSSSRTDNYNCSLRLRNIYGTKYGFYKTIAVPMAFILGLVLPRQATANTYASPFLVKGFMDGEFTINLGMITDCQINKSVNQECRTLDGLPNEVDITFTITDLYSDLSMSPQENPLLFINNTSLIEFLATTCGLSLVTPQLSKKADLAWNSISTATTTYPKTVMSHVLEEMDTLLFQIVGL